METESESTAGMALVEREPFGTTAAGEPVALFMLRNANGLDVRVATYGGIVTSLRTPDRAGELADVVLGFDLLAPYLAGTPYFGAIIGRYANRIAHASFTLDGHRYTLSRNEGENQLHGGERGFDKVVWDAEPFENEMERGLVLRHTSPDGDQGYPGRLATAVTYTLTDDDELVVDYRATTDRPTPVNLTQHSYFNLAGAGNGNVLDHEVMIVASAFTPVDATMIPTGEITSVEGTPFDFRKPARIGSRIDADDVQLRRAGGYDQNFVLDRKANGVELAARATDPASGRTLEVLTTQPGVQFYTGNSLDGTIKGRGGRVYGPRSAFCLETQHFPDSPNHPSFPSTIVRPGEEYRSRTVFAFGVAG